MLTLRCFLPSGLTTHNTTIPPSRHYSPPPAVTCDSVSYLCTASSALVRDPSKNTDVCTSDPTDCDDTDCCMAGTRERRVSSFVACLALSKNVMEYCSWRVESRGVRFQRPRSIILRNPSFDRRERDSFRFRAHGTRSSHLRGAIRRYSNTLLWSACWPRRETAVVCARPCSMPIIWRKNHDFLGWKVESRG